MKQRFKTGIGAFVLCVALLLAGALPVCAVKAHPVPDSGMTLDTSELLLELTSEDPAPVAYLTVQAPNDYFFLIWTSSAPSVASVDGTGKVTGHSEGTASITACNERGEKTACTVTVRKSTVARPVLNTTELALTITEQDAKAVLPKLSHMFGEPFADSSQIPTYLVSKLTREHVTVSLSGDGGDELFCGYGTYQSITNAWNKIRKIPQPVRSAAGYFLTDGAFSKKETNQIRGMLLSAHNAEELYARSDLSEPFLGKIAKERGSARSIFETYESGYLADVQHNLMLMDLLMYHPDDILVKVDRTAMAVSLESRVPMLDKDVVEFAWSLPVWMKWENGRGKLVLRDVLYRHVPRELMERPKKGFSIPIQKWLKEPELYAWAESLLKEDKIRQEGYFDPEMVTRLWKDFTQRGIWRKQIWHILRFEDWLEQEYRKP